MRIYLDTCCLHRPLDDQTQSRIALETEAILAILDTCDDGKHSLVRSDVMEYENRQANDPIRRALAQEFMRMAAESLIADELARQRAIELAAHGFRGLDALHVAVAEAAGLDRLCTCDDRFLRVVRRDLGLRITIVDPLELAREIVI